MTDTAICEWFALCDNPATTTRSHPILGDVPICDRCDAKVVAMEDRETEADRAAFYDLDR